MLSLKPEILEKIEQSLLILLRGEMPCSVNIPLCYIVPSIISKGTVRKICQMCKKVIVISVTNSLDKFLRIAI